MLIFADVQEISSAQHEGRHIKMSVDHGLTCFNKKSIKVLGFHSGIGSDQLHL